MVSAFILYYLNIKATHGYEIQRFLQVSGAEQWTKIQSGSIYYALTKLEKEKHIRVLREERTGSRVRKIYEITESGKEELYREMAEELDKPISGIGSMKFFIGPMLNSLKEEDIIRIVQAHILKLEEMKEYWEKWSHIKVDETSDELSKLSFKITIDSISNQIAWHNELLNNLDKYMKSCEETEQIIKSINFDQMTEVPGEAVDEQRLQYALLLKNEIMKDPQNAVDNLDKIIEQLQKQIKDR
jgi:Predicted transcriptional regulators